MSVCSYNLDDSNNMENDDFNSSGCGDMSFEMSGDTAEDLSMSPQHVRKLNFSSNRNDHHVRTPAPTKLSFSPPYKRVRALRLFDSPLTPKTIIQKSTSASTPLPRSRLFGDKPKGVPSAYAEREKPAANVNPFTPDGQLLSKKRSRSVRSLDSPKFKPPILNLNDSDEEEEIEQPTKRVALQESNILRYHKEFVELDLIGEGEFGSVFKCLNRLDGCVYAIKKSTKPVAGSSFEKTALNEVYAHAVLGKHQHVVRYYSAWAEDNHMIIQNEYCNGGSLADKIAKEPLSAAELRRMLLHVTEGLRYIHSQGLVHMDLKPGNIFISIERKNNLTSHDTTDDGFEDLEDNHMYDEALTYKIGDLGHVTSITNPQVEEGDCRYLSNEILHEDYTHLTKADVFAMGLTALECAGASPLPKNGPQWHSIREGHIPPLPQKLTKDLLELVKSMIHPDPTQRPSTVQILQHRALNPDCSKSKADLTRELKAEKLRNEMLVKQLKEAALCIKSIQNSRLIGKKVNRSVSTTTF